MNQKEARDMLRQNPLSFLQVTRSDAALPESIAEDDPQVYEKARENPSDTLPPATTAKHAH